MKTSAARDTWVSYGQNSVDSGPTRTFFWDWYQRAGHGAELLGDITNRAVVEVGAGAGKQAAALVRELDPAQVTAVDSSPAQHARARELHDDLTELEMVHADAAAYLQQRPGAFYVCYSVFGAIDFADPHILLPAIGNALAPDGRLVFSTLGHFHSGHPAETDARPTKIPVRQPDGTTGTLNRWVLGIPVWTKLLEEAGFEIVATLTVDDPGTDGRPAIATNIFRAHRSN
ncbi:class I SAM-dependent methyltransferase [Streptomyces sp. NPDC047917]|uniref:class I SAM-dependent methyltransferase n=1 Tax=Streptomyces sp. NPDC047917 TaxID=3365491 RepID=UPI003714E5F4